VKNVSPNNVFSRLHISDTKIRLELVRN